MVINSMWVVIYECRNRCLCYHLLVRSKCCPFHISFFSIDALFEDKLEMVGFKSTKCQDQYSFSSLFQHDLEDMT